VPTQIITKPLLIRQ